MSMRSLILTLFVAAPLAAQTPVAAPRMVDEPRPVERPMLAQAPVAVGHLPGLEHPDTRYSQDPADSTYRAARTLLNRGEWRRAATLFASIATRYPNSEYRADALYWQAFALYRIGGTAELREAMTVLGDRKTRFPNARSESDAATLENRIRGALAARGDATAAAELARTASLESSSCDEEDQSVRASALRALVRSNAAAALPQIDRVLARRDECSLPLRRNAVLLLGEMEDQSGRDRLLAVAANDPSEDLRVDAIGYVGRIPGDASTAALENILRNDNEERLQRAAVSALGRRDDARSKALVRATVERSSASERLRLAALESFSRGETPEIEWQLDCQGGRACVPDFRTSPRPVVAPTAPTPPSPATPPTPAARPAQPAPPSGARSPSYADYESDVRRNRVGLSADDAAWLRGVYPRLETTRLKSRAASVLTRATDAASVTWLVALIQNDEEASDTRAAVLARLGRNLPIAQLGRLFDAASDRTVRLQIVSTLGNRDEPEATDKLISIVRTGTDPQLRRSAVSALTRKNDPRATQLLLELVDR
jgi:HEAT repeat protein